MSAEDFATTIEIDRPPREVFDAIKEPRSWWSDAVQGHADVVGAKFVFDGGDHHTWMFQVTEMAPAERIVWHVTDSTMSWVKDTSEWTGTDVKFELSEAGAGTLLRFTHVGLHSDLECFECCSRGWTGYITDSLPNLVTTGHGRPGAY